MPTPTDPIKNPDQQTAPESRKVTLAGECWEVRTHSLTDDSPALIGALTARFSDRPRRLPGGRGFGTGACGPGHRRSS